MPGRSNRRDARVYAFIGEPSLAEERANAVLTKLIAGERRDLDLEVVRLPDDPIERVDEALCQVGMFARGRCVLLKGPLELEAHVDGLLRFLETKFPPDAALVIATPKIDRRGKLYRWLHEHATIEDLRIDPKGESRGADTSSLASAIDARIRANGFPPPDAAVVDALLARLGTSAGELCNEVDRLCLTIGTPRVLTVKDITDVVRDSAGAWIFDFVNAICERQAGPALTLVAALLAGGDAPLRIVGTLSTKVAELLVASRYARTAKLPPPPANATAFARNVYPGLPEAARRRFANPYRAYHVFRVGQSRGSRALRELHRQLLELDLALKSGGGQPRHLLCNFVLSACGRGA